MNNWKILITDGLHESGQALLRAAAQADDRNDIPADELLKIVGDYDALIVRGRTKVNAAVLEAGTRLKVVGRAGVGVDNIDLKAAAARGVAVVNAPKSTSLAVAELAIGLMFAVARMIPRADSSMKAGQWIKKQLEGIELSGKTLGVIGMGNIGAAVAQRCAALGMTILGYDPLIPADVIRQRAAEPVSLADLYARSDFITIHIPLIADTKGMIGAAAFAQMKPGVRLIDAARGGVVDEAALVDALNSGQVAAAGMDVFAVEPPTGVTPLVAHPNVVATPHVGAQTEEAQTRASFDIASEVLNGLRGEPLRWKVN
jgi:D-3-phosphoglycerate dehydrogenase / 2-oxoglutarate reductase